MLEVKVFKFHVKFEITEYTGIPIRNGSQPPIGKMGYLKTLTTCFEYGRKIVESYLHCSVNAIVSKITMVAFLI